MFNFLNENDFDVGGFFKETKLLCESNSKSQQGVGIWKQILFQRFLNPEEGQNLISHLWENINFLIAHFLCNLNLKEKDNAK